MVTFVLPILDRNVLGFALRNDVRKHVVVCSDAPIDPDGCIVAKPAYIGLDF